jgi:hypothetical protein
MKDKLDYAPQAPMKPIQRWINKWIDYASTLGFSKPKTMSFDKFNKKNNC